MTGPLELPARPLEVPAGTLLQLAAGDWTPGRGDLTAGTDVAVVLSALCTNPADNGWLWVIGHRPQCAYAAAEEHLPCVELRVRLDVLFRYGCSP